MPDKEWMDFVSFLFFFFSFGETIFPFQSKLFTSHYHMWEVYKLLLLLLFDFFIFYFIGAHRRETLVF